MLRLDLAAQEYRFVHRADLIGLLKDGALAAGVTLRLLTRGEDPDCGDAFVGGVQVFGWREGRVYEVWTAPLRVTTVTLAPGETVTAKAAGDTVRWQIGESRSGAAVTGADSAGTLPLLALGRG